jgi:putative selenium metabolism protein SsnA
MALALTGGTVVTSLSPPRLLHGDVLVERGRVGKVGRVTGGDRRIDCSGCLVIPGNVCAHHHLYSALARGMPFTLEPPTNFVEILRRVWWRLDRALDLPAVSLSAWAGGADALLAGTTTIVDHHASPNVIQHSLEHVGRALDGLGLRSVLCYEVTDRDGPEPATLGLEENRRFLEGGGLPLARAMVGAHASFTLSPETLAACVELAREFEAGIHVHVAEDRSDQRNARARFGTGVVERLAEAGALDRRSLLAHCIHVGPQEAAMIRDSGATPVHNARSNMNNAVGHAPVALLGEGLALGTDGIGGDMFAEGRAAYWRAQESRVVAGPSWVLDRLAASARFAGAVFGEPLLGTVGPGAPADLVVLEYEAPTPLSAENLAGHWVFGLSARQVRDVVVNGETVVRDRRLTRADRVELAARARETAERLWRRMDEIPEHTYVPVEVS